MQAQGYVRFRVDGTAYEAADVPKLKKTEKHDIDVVIDRVKVQPGLQQRLAESFEAALRIADGRAMALEMDTAKEHLFSSKFACPVCSYSLERTRTAPVLVQLAGRRLPDLRRPGPHHGVRRRARRRLPVAEPGQRRGEGLGPAQRLHLLAARKRGAPLPVRHRRRRSSSCPKHAQQVLLHGSGDEEIEFVYEAEGARGKIAQRQTLAPVRRHPAEPVAALSRDRFGRGARRPAALPERQALPRLRRHAAAARSAPRVPGRCGQRRARADLPRRALHAARVPGLLRDAATAGREGRDRRQGGARDPLAPEVPERRGPELPEPGPQRRHALAAASRSASAWRRRSARA